MTHFRRIDITGMQPADLAPQPAPQMLWVEIAQLVIDDRYQRPINEGNRKAIKRIAAAFRWSRFSPVIVAPIEGGRYALIDGQHRAHAAALCGIESIPAMVALVAPEEQAQAFIEINTRQIRVGSEQVYRAALTANEPWAIACRDTVASAGCRLMTAKYTTSSKKPGQVFCVDLIRRMVNLGKADAVTNGLAALLEYEHGATANFSNTLLSPWLSAAAETGASIPALVDALRARKPWLVIETADRLAKAKGRSLAVVRREFFVASIHAAERVAA